MNWWDLCEMAPCFPQILLGVVNTGTRIKTLLWMSDTCDPLYLKKCISNVQMTKHVFLHFPPLPNQIKHNEQQTDPPSKFTHQGMQLQMRAGICLTYYGRARGHKHFRAYCGIIVTVLQTAEYFWNIWGVRSDRFSDFVTVETVTVM